MTTTPDAARGILACQGHLFEIPEDVTYLNCANMAPQLRSVSHAGAAAVVVSTWANFRSSS